MLRRHEQQLHAQLNKNVTITVQGARVRVALSIVPDEEGASATLSAQDPLGEELARVPVSPAFRLTVDSALRWAESGFERPRSAPAPLAAPGESPAVDPPPVH